MDRGFSVAVPTVRQIHLSAADAHHWGGCGPTAGAQLWLSPCLQPSSEVGSCGIAVPAGVAVAVLGPFGQGGVGPCSYQLALMKLAQLAQRRWLEP